MHSFTENLLFVKKLNFYFKVLGQSYHGSDLPVSDEGTIYNLMFQFQVIFILRKYQFWSWVVASWASITGARLQSCHCHREWNLILGHNCTPTYYKGLSLPIQPCKPKQGEKLLSLFLVPSIYLFYVIFSVRYGDEECIEGDRCWEGMSCRNGFCRCNQGIMTSDKTFCLRERERLLGQQCTVSHDICYQRAGLYKEIVTLYSKLQLELVFALKYEFRISNCVIIKVIIAYEIHFCILQA